MVVFQLLLLCGYTYTYLSSRYLTVGRQSSIHLTLFAFSLLLMPFALHPAGFEAHAHPQMWLLTTLILSVGAPYLLLSSNAPMLQRWAANTSHPLSKNPYPLYAASNAGSLLGLLAYPFLIEPLFTTTQQFGVLTAGFLALVFSFGCCVVIMRRYEHSPAIPVSAAPNMPLEKAPLFRWLAYSAIPASLLFGTTTFIITDIASVPLLWIGPLTLYISSFILAFSERQYRIRVLVGIYVPVGLLTLFGSVSASLAGRVGVTPAIEMMLTLTALLFGTFMFHRRLYELRPRAQDSGLFYVILALGGAIGGCFNSFVAPVIFSTAGEFPLMLALSLLVALLPDFLSTTVPRKQGFPIIKAASLIFLLLSMKLYFLSGVDPWKGWFLAVSAVMITLTIFIALVLSDWFYKSPWKAVFAILVVGLFGGHLAAAHGSSWLYVERNFFGISRVHAETDHDRLIYSHGVTMHGVQSTQEQFRLKPTSYYGPPLRDVFANLPAADLQTPIGVIGLGIGTVACYAAPAQQMDFYEIDPASIHIATNPTYFTFMRDCPGQRRIIVGDGRITLNQAPDGAYGLIIIDAFTSDAIPMHLLTLEALTMYGRKLQPHGLIAFNISNKYLDLLPVFRTLSTALGWTGTYRFDVEDSASLAVSSLWVVLGKDDTDTQLLQRVRGWKALPDEAGKQYRWTDDYTNLLNVLRLSPNWTSAL